MKGNGLEFKLFEFVMARLDTEIIFKCLIDTFYKTIRIRLANAIDYKY